MTLGLDKNIWKYTDYRDILLGELERRQGEDPSYSLRSMAKALGISVGTLSEVLHRKHGLSAKKAAVVAEHLNLAEKERAYFCDLVMSQDARTIKRRELAQKRINQNQTQSTVREISEDHFNFIADWYHLAILSLISTKNFSGTIPDIAKRLRLGDFQVEQAVMRMQRLKMLEYKDGKVKVLEKKAKTTDEIPSAAIRSFHKEYLNKARVALEQQSIHEREIATMIFSLKKSDMEAAKHMLKDFRREFMERFGCEENGDEVYCLNMSLFGVSK